MKHKHFFKNIVFFIGPPASGKDTQAEILAKELNGKLLTTSSLLRDFFSQNKKKFLYFNNKKIDLRREERKMLNGKLVNSNLVLYVLLNSILNLTKKYNLLLFAGSPRTLKEAKQELTFFNTHNINFLTIFLDIDEKEIIKRALKRARIDDKKAIVLKRINFYKRNTLPAIKFLAKHKVLLSINGKGSILQVHKRILRALTNCLHI
ncbi:MAG: hypothetical protein KatS3mg097_446 [Candidatus Parcubacteria bacterium]|nr:MAG: hypothetical protein KatS3mg097_446 [Candidatus Parcubacteria bacterium]